MDSTICDTVDSLLESVQNDIEDPNLIFKLRTARQLSVACKDEMDSFQRTLENADIDEDTETRLQKLGYL